MNRKTNNVLSALILTITIYAGYIDASEFTIPFGLPTAPDARLIVSDAYDSGVDTREEFIARFGTQQPLQDIITFYQSALADAGFKTSLPSDRGDSLAITAQRDRDRIRITATSDVDWAEPGENEIVIVAIYDK